MLGTQMRGQAGQLRSLPGTVVAIAGAAAALFLLVLLLILSASFIESSDTDQIMVIQSWRTGQMRWFPNGGTHAQWWGKVTKYQKRDEYNIETQVRFNDGGHGTLKGSVQYELPLDDTTLSSLHTRFGNPEAIKRQLIETVVVKSVYMTGPLMSSKESYAEKRNELISNVEDQIENGVYRTRQREVRVVDPLTNQEKTALVVEIVQGQNGQPLRAEDPVLSGFGIKTFNFSVKELVYDAAVETQIQQQQQITMQVQTAIAESRQAEQRAITVEQQGKADAAAAKWAQEVIKATEVTKAQQQLEVAQLRNREMEQYRESEFKRADADATYRRRMMDADGALDKKLATYERTMQFWAQAFQNYTGQITPSVVMGGNAGSQNAAMNFMDLMGVKAAQDLALQLRPTPAHTPAVKPTGGQ